MSSNYRSTVQGADFIHAKSPSPPYFDARPFLALFVAASPAAAATCSLPSVPSQRHGRWRPPKTTTAAATSGGCSTLVPLLVLLVPSFFPLLAPVETGKMAATAMAVNSTDDAMLGWWLSAMASVPSSCLAGQWCQMDDLLRCLHWHCYYCCLPSTLLRLLLPPSSILGVMISKVPATDDRRQWILLANWI